MARVKYYVYILVADSSRLLVKVSMRKPAKHAECIEDALLPEEGDCGTYRSMSDAVNMLKRIMEWWAGMQSKT